MGSFDSSKVLPSLDTNLKAIGNAFKGLNPMNTPFGKMLGLDGLGQSITDPNTWNSLANSLTQAGPTGRDLWQAQREDTGYQRATADMKEAGLNPALMYGSGQAAPSSPASSGQAMSLSDMLELATLPAKLENINADSSLKRENARNVAQRTLTEEQETRIRTIAAEFGVELTTAEIDELLSRIDLNDASAERERSQVDLINSQTDAQEIINDYLPRKLSAEIDQLKAGKLHLEASAALSKAQADFTIIQSNYAEANGFLMSSNDKLLLATYLADLYGISKGDLKGAIRDIINPYGSKKSHSSGGGER